MKVVGRLANKVGFLAIGVGAGIILAAGSGFAAVQLSRNIASDHSIDAVQSHSSDAAAIAERSSVSGTDDPAGVDDRASVDDRAGTDDRTGTVEPEPETNDDRTSKPTPTTASGRSGHDDTVAHRSPEPGDDGRKSGKH